MNKIFLNIVVHITLQIYQSIGRVFYREVVSEQLHDQRAVLVRILVQRIEFSNGIIERLQTKI